MFKVSQIDYTWFLSLFPFNVHKAPFKFTICVCKPASCSGSFKDEGRLGSPKETKYKKWSWTTRSEH
jgi:hypothetical protein